MPQKVTILNDGLGPNKGDQAILRAMFSTLEECLPRAEISVLPYQWRLRNLVKEMFTLFQSDLVILGGGQVLHDQTSVPFTLLVLSKIAFARALKIRVMGYAIGVGPLKTRVARWVAKKILNRFELITVREPTSPQLLKEIGITKPPVVITADASFLLQAAAQKRVKETFIEEDLTDLPHPMIAIAPRRWFHYHHSLIPVKYKARAFGFLRGQEEFARLEQTIARVADELIIQRGASILFIPMRRSYGRVDPGQDDDRVATEIHGYMKYKKNARVLARDYSPEEMKGVLGQMDLVIGMRMHSLILGSSMGVPVIGIGITPKFDGFFQMIAQDFSLVDAHAPEEVFLDKVQFALSHRETIQKELLIRADYLRGQALVNNQLVVRLLQEP